MTPITLTPLEATLFTSLWSVALIVLSRVVMGSKSVSKSDCDACKRGQAAREKAINQKLSVIFKMIRALIVHSDIPKEIQEDIINYDPAPLENPHV